MHQLSALRGSAFPYLDSHAFAARVRDLLARIPPESAAQGFAAQAHP